MHLLKLTFCLVITALSSFASISAQNWVSYQSPQQINDLVETNNELFIATDAGLVVMNKNTLQKSIFDKKNTNLSNNHIQTIAKSPDGNLWIGTYDGMLSRFDEEELNFKDTIAPQGNFNPNNFKLYDLKIASNGDFWLGTSEGAFQKKGTNWLQFDQNAFGSNSTDIWDIEIVNDNEILFASFDIHELKNGNWSNISSNAQFNNYANANIFISQSGKKFFCGDIDKIASFDGLQWQIFEIDSFDANLNGIEITGFTEDTNGDIYFNSTSNGVYKLENDTWIKQQNAQTTAFNDQANYWYIDQQGNKWLNSNIYLSVNKNGTLQTTSIAAHTIEYNEVYNLHKANNGSMYFISAGTNNIACLDMQGNWSFLNLPNSSNAQAVSQYRDMLFIDENNIWLSANNGVFYYNGIEWIHYEQYPNSYNFIGTPQGQVYLRTAKSIHLFDNGTITNYIIQNGTLTPYTSQYSPSTAPNVSGFGIDANNNIWVASNTENGNEIYKISSNGTSTIYTQNEYPEIQLKLFGEDFYFDVQGNVWLPTQVGAIKFDATSWTNPLLENLDNSINRTVVSITNDADGKIYFSTPNGIITTFNDNWEVINITDVPLDYVHKTKIDFDNQGTLWWASDRFGVFAYTNSISTAANHHLLQATNIFSIFPNPAQNYTTIEATIPQNATVTLFIYNSLGQLVANSDLGKLPAGKFQQKIQTNHWQKGLYNVQLQINHHFYTQKLLVF